MWFLPFCLLVSAIMDIIRPILYKSLQNCTLYTNIFFFFFVQYCTKVYKIAHYMPTFFSSLLYNIVQKSTKLHSICQHFFFFFFCTILYKSLQNCTLYANIFSSFLQYCTKVYKIAQYMPTFFSSFLYNIVQKSTKLHTICQHFFFFFVQYCTKVYKIAPYMPTFFPFLYNIDLMKSVMAESSSQ